MTTGNDNLNATFQNDSITDANNRDAHQNPSSTHDDSRQNPSTTHGDSHQNPSATHDDSRQKDSPSPRSLGHDVEGTIFSNMSEGTLLIGMKGVIELVNDAALAIFEKKREEVENKVFARVFLDTNDLVSNDDFIQCVLDTIYQKGRRLEQYTHYYTGGREKQLRIVSSSMSLNDELKVILVISDVTELVEMKDAMKAMRRIDALNRKLELQNNVLQKTFGRYISDEVVEEIMHNPGGWRLGGQKVELTILISDLRNFTTICEHMDASDLILMLNHYFSEMDAAITKYGGTLIEFLGDGMFIIFGAPIQAEDHASRAVAAAIAMQNRMTDVNAWNEERGFPHLTMGIGINTDKVILGNIGSLRRVRFGAIGAAVNLTGRIESYSYENQVLISPNTRRAIQADLTVFDTINIRPKGVTEDVTIYEVTAIGAPYEESYERAADERTSLATPLSVSFFLMDGKHVADAPKTGSISGLSTRSACLQSKNLPGLYEDIKLDVAGGVYAKVVDFEDSAAVIKFTGKPEGFDEWVGTLIK